MIAGTQYPGFADALATFCAHTLYLTSDMAIKATEKRALIAEFSGNAALCQITEDLIFTDPYRIAESNRWTSPQLDGWAEAVRHDADLKIAVSRLKLKFLSSAQALLHGDLHTGSVMVTETDTRVIDPEFAFVGPMGFDLGAVIANLLLSYFSQSGHEKTPGERDGYRAWILETITAFWTRFRARFLDLWRDQPTGDAYPPALFEGERGALRLETERQAFMDAVFADTVGFAGAKMTRRLLGLAHNIDLEWIEDPDRRALAETRALRLARALMVNGDGFSSIEAVCAAAQAVEATQPSLQ
jgi:5-methylthioribose kinase